MVTVTFSQRAKHSSANRQSDRGGSFWYMFCHNNSARRVCAVWASQTSGVGSIRTLNCTIGDQHVFVYIFTFLSFNQVTPPQSSQTYKSYSLLVYRCFYGISTTTYIRNAYLYLFFQFLIVHTLPILFKFSINFLFINSFAVPIHFFIVVNYS